ncbi:MAG: putative transport system permease protein [Blastocatellia bacterium]|nr:putative transport system permease protein [Blastocatellia bacterium]
MKLVMIIRVAFRALARNKMRAALTMLGIIIGVSAVIAMVSIGQGAQASVQAQIQSIGTNLLFVSAGAQNAGGVRTGAGDTGTNTLTAEDLDAIRREVPSVAMVTPTVNSRSQLVFGNMNWNTSVQGVNEQYPDVRKWSIQSGEFFTDSDVRTAARVIVIGQTIADNLFAGMDPVGQTVRVMNLPFRVTGVMVRKGQDQQGRDQDDIAFAPFTTVQKKLIGSPRLQIAYVSAVTQDATYTAQQQISDLLRQRHKLTANEPNDFTVRNMTDVAEAANETNNTMTVLLACIAGVSLLVGGIGIMNIMLVSVTERTREIGIRMAIGARSSAVRTQFLIESIVLSLTGGFLGIMLGIVVSLLIPALLGWPTLISTIAIIGSVIFSGAVGIFFGYYPARKAAALDPIEALRYE